MTDSTTIKQLLLETTVGSLETMAFFCCEPASEDALSPEDAVSVEMVFKGPQSGTVQIVASKFFGQRLASNALCCGVTDPDAIERAEDSIRELINVVVGALMPRIAEKKSDVFSLSLPSARAFDSNAEWEAFAHGEGVCLIDAEGETVGLRLQTA
jgi:hypothetical protein